MNYIDTTPIIILGMHRSGTSCLAGSLQQSGVFLGDVSTNDKHNQKGNRENQLIMLLNDDILHHNNSSWNIPPTKDISWDNSHISTANDILEYFNSNTLSKYWGFKDPRSILTFDFWINIVKNPFLIGSVRHPALVARSLQERNSAYSYESGLELWLAYNIKLLELLRKQSFPVISFDLNDDEYTEKLLIINELIGINTDNSNAFFEPALRSSSSNIDISLPRDVLNCYNDLKHYFI